VFTLSAESKVIFTGGSGLLGTAMKKIRPDIDYPPSSRFNVTNFSQMNDYVSESNCEILIHAAAFISPPAIDKNPLRAIEVNIIGTSNIVTICMKYDIRLVYISTDYVFRGDKGNYKETDALYPVNKYAWSKLGGECAVRLYDKSLIVRTSFSPDVFPYEKAFVDQWTSRESVSTFAKKLNRLIDSSVTGVMHVAGPRRTVFDYAKSLDPSKAIGKLSIADVNFHAPIDTSLNCERYVEATEEKPSREKGR
jgi:dTDP-4-dehydrorhamnose reductase